MDDEKAMQIAEETRLREAAQSWASKLMEAQDKALPEMAEIEQHYKSAVRDYERSLSGFDDGEDA